MKRQEIRCLASNSGSGGRGKSFAPVVKRMAYVEFASHVWNVTPDQTMRQNGSILHNEIIMHCLSSNSGSSGRGKAFGSVVRRQNIAQA